MSSFDVEDEEIDPEDLDDRADDVLDGDFVTFEEHEAKRE
jgi:hypothetical protein